MKALELIEQIEDVEENKYHKTRTIIFNSDDMAFIREAKAELEALQQPKNCDGCRSKSCSVKRILLELGEINSSYFYCNDYEPKEQ